MLDDAADVSDSEAATPWDRGTLYTHSKYLLPSRGSRLDQFWFVPDAKGREDRRRIGRDDPSAVGHRWCLRICAQRPDPGLAPDGRHCAETQQKCPRACRQDRGRAAQEVYAERLTLDTEHVARMASRQSTIAHDSARNQHPTSRYAGSFCRSLRISNP